MIKTIIASVVTAALVSVVILGIALSTSSANLGGRIETVASSQNDKFTVVDSRATSTVKIHSIASGKQGCIELGSTNGTSTRITASTTAAVLTVAFGTCE